jgi:chromosome segregation ATPase
MDVLITLMNKVAQRRETLKELKRKGEIHQQAVRLQTSTMEIKQLVQDAKRDHDQLSRLARMLEQQSQSAVQLLAEYKAQSIELKQEMSLLMEADASVDLYATVR